MTHPWLNETNIQKQDTIIPEEPRPNGISMNLINRQRAHTENKKCLLLFKNVGQNQTVPPKNEQAFQFATARSRKLMRDLREEDKGGFGNNQIFDVKTCSTKSRESGDNVPIDLNCKSSRQ